MPRHPLTCLRFKIAKTTVFLSVEPATTLSSLQETLFSALEATSSSSASSPGPASDLADPDAPQLADVPPLPTSPSDIAFWRLEPGEAGTDAADKWIRLTDDKSGAGKLGLNEAEEVGVSFKADDGSFPPPVVERPQDDEEVDAPM
ncbi:hypothetical protein JCM10212_002932 [Sporobolomyces blumeae]